LLLLVELLLLARPRAGARVKVVCHSAVGGGDLLMHAAV
jgi:hypothetical protein